MSKEIKCWQCDFCKNAFLTKEDADHCEKWHSDEENLEIIEIGKYSQNERFPMKLLIGDKTYSGTLAEYKLNYQSSVEDFYEKEEWGGEE